MRPPGVSTCISPKPTNQMASMCQMTRESEEWTETMARFEVRDRSICSWYFQCKCALNVFFMYIYGYHFMSIWSSVMSRDLPSLTHFA